MAPCRRDGLVNFGDIVVVDFGVPMGSEAGFRRPAIVTTADSFLRLRPSTVFVVPLTTTPRLFPSHITVEPDPTNRLTDPSTALVEQMRAVAGQRCALTGGNVGPMVSHQILDILAMMTGMP